MNDIVSYTQDIFKECNDLKYKKIKIKLKIYHLFYLETLCSSDKINDYILKAFASENDIKNIFKDIPSPNFVNVDNKDKIEYYLLNGYAVIIIKNEIYAIEVKADLDRSITESTTDPTLYGPKDALVEMDGIVIINQ